MQYWQKIILVRLAEIHLLHAVLLTALFTKKCHQVTQARPSLVPFIPTNVINCRLHSIMSERIGNPEPKAALKCVHEYNIKEEC